MKSIIFAFAFYLSFQIQAQIFNPIKWKSESILWSTYSRNPYIDTDVKIKDGQIIQSKRIIISH